MKEQIMTEDRTTDAPFPDTARTGWSFISPCCTAGVTEFLVDGVYWLAGSVAGHGWSKPWPGRIADINDDGTVTAPDGSERRIRWRPERDQT
jgi:hypothetical protein